MVNIKQLANIWVGGRKKGGLILLKFFAKNNIVQRFEMIKNYIKKKASNLKNVVQPMVSFYAHIVANARMQITWEKQHTLEQANHKTKERKNNL